jgi:hypothetical protein
LFLKADNKRILSYFLAIFQPEVIQKESWILRRIISVCRAFNSEHFDKKEFLKSIYFDGEKVKILWLLGNHFFKNLKKPVI